VRDAPLTETQAEILAFIDACCCRGIPPTRLEIGEHFGWSSPKAATTSHLKPLAKKGFVEIDTKAARGIRILKRRDGNKVLIRGRWYEFVRFEEETN